ncbi:MAG: DnaJ domain-containing protein [Bacteroidetes bacterium]|nr:DnaJ domain-containing protein [Bacteroidota bacterium]
MQYDYYKILDIPRDASLEDIKKAYRLKAKLVHPDVNNSPKANEVFAVVSEAYDVLCDDQKRYLHDVKLNYYDTEKENAERKRQYYGTSVRNDSFSNPSNFNYDWNSFSQYAYKEKNDEDYYKQSPFLYNLFFASGMFIGFIIITVTIYGTLKNFWPLPFVLISISGFILVREGWRGMMGKQTMLNGILKRLKK